MSRPPAHPVAAQIPLLLAITGHRDPQPEAIPQLRQALRRVIQSIRRRHCPDTPIHLLSGLAEGADRIAAEVALTEGTELIAVLPFDVERYREDFPDTVAEFDELLAQASQIIELPSPERIDTKQDRERQYRQLGGYLAERSHILLALWNQADTGKAGGVSDIIKHHCEGRYVITPPGHADPLDSPDPGPVVHIATPRLSDDVRVEAGATQWEYPHTQELFAPDAARHRFAQIFNEISRFNRATSQWVRRRPDAIASCSESLGELPEDYRDNELVKHIRHTFGAADFLAQRNQRAAFWAWRLVFLLAGVMVLSFELYAHLLTDALWVLAVFPVAFSVMAAIYMWHNSRRYYDRFLDYRALAEALRVQHYWYIAGLAEGVSESYRNKFRGELRWVREALKGYAPTPASEDHSDERCLTALREHWIQDQLRFFKSRVRREHRRNWWYRALAYSTYGASLILSVGLVAAVSKHLLHDHTKHVLLVLMGLGPAAAGLWLGYRERMAIEEQLWQYDRARNLYQRADHVLQRLDVTDNATVVLDLIRSLGLESLDENGEWVLMHRQRPLAIPMG